MTSSVATLVKCVNDKGKSALWVARKAADEIKEERATHQLQSQVWVVTKALCYNGSERWEDHREFVDEDQKDVCEFAQIQVVPPAEKGPSKVALLVEVCTD